MVIDGSPGTRSASQRGKACSLLFADLPQKTQFLATLVGYGWYEAVMPEGTPRFWRELVAAFQGLERDKADDRKVAVLELATTTGEIFHGLVASYDANSRWLRLDVYESVQDKVPSMIVAIPEHAIARLALIYVDLQPDDAAAESRPRIGFEFVPKTTDDE
jgi:hypothetical protein